MVHCPTAYWQAGSIFIFHEVSDFLFSSLFSSSHRTEQSSCFSLPGTSHRLAQVGFDMFLFIYILLHLPGHRPYFSFVITSLPKRKTCDNGDFRPQELNKLIPAHTILLPLFFYRQSQYKNL